LPSSPRLPQASSPRPEARPAPLFDPGLALLVLIWGLNFPVIKQTLAELDPLVFNALRFPLAAFVLLLLLRVQGSIPLPARRDFLPVAGLAIVGNVLYQLLFILGLDRTASGNASVLLATTPIWVTLLSSAAGHEEIRPATWMAIAGAMAGIVMVVVGGDAEVRFDGEVLAGSLLVVVAAIVWGIYSVGSRSLIHRYGALPLTTWSLVVGGGVNVLLGVPGLLALDFRTVSVAGWIGVVYAGILGIGMAYLLWNRSVRKVGNAATSLHGSLVPVVAVGIGWLWLGEVPTPTQLAGGAVVVGSLLLVRRGGRR